MYGFPPNWFRYLETKPQSATSFLGLINTARAFVSSTFQVVRKNGFLNLSYNAESPPASSSSTPFSSAQHFASSKNVPTKSSGSCISLGYASEGGRTTQIPPPLELMRTGSACELPVTSSIDLSDAESSDSDSLSTSAAVPAPTAAHAPRLTRFAPAPPPLVVPAVTEFPPGLIIRTSSCGLKSPGPHLEPATSPRATILLTSPRASCKLTHSHSLNHHNYHHHFVPECISVGLFCEQGTRTSNEDAVFALEIPGGLAVACFDGHGGADVAQHLTEAMPPMLTSRASFIRARGASEVASIVLGFEEQLQSRYREEWHPAGRDPGSTALVAALVGGSLHIANVGDCRLVLAAEAVDAQGNRMAYVARTTRDHAPKSNQEEHRRVQAAGGFVDSHGYVGSMLEVSRSIGDFRIKSELGKGVIIPDPETLTVQLTPDSLFAVLVSDGISSHLDDMQIVNQVSSALNNPKHLNEPEYAARELALYAVSSLGSSDNCSAVVICFRSQPPPMPARRRLFCRK